MYYMVNHFDTSTKNSHLYALVHHQVAVDVPIATVP